MMNSVNVSGHKVTPSKIICVGRNYVDHIRELNNEIPQQIVIFIKPNSAISTRLRAKQGEALHYETELCFLYQCGRFCAVGLGLDLTKRTMQSQLKTQGLPWERAKAFDGSAIFSQFIPLQAGDMDELAFTLSVDKTIRQRGHVQHMLHRPNDILVDIQSFMSLEDGDIVMTGTPKGVGEVELGRQYQLTLTRSGEPVVTEQFIAGE